MSIAKEGRRLHHGTLDFAEGWRARLAEAADLRRRITATRGVTIRDIEHKARLTAQAGKPVRRDHHGRQRDHRHRRRAAETQGQEAGRGVPGPVRHGQQRRHRETDRTGQEEPPGPASGRQVEREPFHWPLAFPEIFVDTPNPASTPSSAIPHSWVARRSPALTATTIWTGSSAGTATTSRERRPRGAVCAAGRPTAVETWSTGIRTVNTLIEGPTLRVGLEQVTSMVSRSVPDAPRIHGRRRAQTCRSSKSGQAAAIYPGMRPLLSMARRFRRSAQTLNHTVAFANALSAYARTKDCLPRL